MYIFFGILDSWKFWTPYDTVMTDRGFKINNDLTIRCYLAIPLSAAKGNQMTSGDVLTTTKVEKVRIFVEKLL